MFSSQAFILSSKAGLPNTHLLSQLFKIWNSEYSRAQLTHGPCNSGFMWGVFGVTAAYYFFIQHLSDAVSQIVGWMREAILNRL